MVQISEGGSSNLWGEPGMTPVSPKLTGSGSRHGHSGCGCFGVKFSLNVQTLKGRAQLPGVLVIVTCTSKDKNTLLDTCWDGL